MPAFFVLFTVLSCGASAEGESCELSNGNEDCEDGLVCVQAHSVRATEAVCCPRPPSAGSSDACKPEVDPGFVPDPRIDGSFAAGGTGVGGSLGAGGAAGAGGADARADSTGSDAASDSARDAGSVGGSSGADAASDSRNDAPPD